MKKLLCFVLCFLTLSGVFTAAVSASALSGAEELYGLGLFLGTGTDPEGNPVFGLEDAATRQQAIVMLIRLLGVEDEALSGGYSHPFTDVDAWADPYVGYAYENKLAAGISSDTFGGNDAVSAAHYITFVLRALGYSSDTDFLWDRAWELSDKIKLTNGAYNEKTTEFLRGDMAFISYSALYTRNKAGTLLIDILIENGAVAEKPAGDMAPKIKEVLYKYSPTGAYIIDSVAQLSKKTPGELISVWTREDGDFIGTLNLAVHEICHMYTGSVTEYEKIYNGIKYTAQNYELDGDDNIIYSDIYIADGTPVIVKYGEQTIKTEAVTGSFPANLKSANWDLYVSPGNENSANLDGVYGMLNEIHAYYSAFKSVIDCFEYLKDYLTEYGYSEDYPINYFASLYNDISIFYEFKFWTLEYLSYLSERHPGEYRAVMDNENYKKVFIYINDSFEYAINNIVPQFAKSVIDKLNGMGIYSGETDDIIWFGNSGIGKFKNEIETMEKEIRSLKNAEVMRDLRK